tara:strand:- start:2150 stop:2635 length:486 start_codon:yes stop_codon:yes gene_type:complete
MKTFKTSISILFLSILLFSCSTNDDDSLTGDDFFTAKVDGINWSAFVGPPDTVAWSEAHQGIIVIQGSDENGTGITMNILNYTGAGTYDFTTAGFIQYVISPLQANSGAWACDANSGTTGSVEITSDDGTIIEGTVSFVGKNPSDSSTKTITLGDFRATKE